MSNFEVGVAPTSTDATESDVSAASDEDTSPSTSTFLRDQIIETSQITPARFTVFGQPNQVFAVTVPTSVVSSAGSGETVTFSDFSHDAGTTPVTGGSGSAVFAVGAAAQVSVDVSSVGETTTGGSDTGDAGTGGGSPADTGSADGFTAEAGTDGDATGTETADASGTASGGDETDDTPPKRSGDPFGFRPNDDKFLNVLVSYN